MFLGFIVDVLLDAYSTSKQNLFQMSSFTQSQVSSFKRLFGAVWAFTRAGKTSLQACFTEHAFALRAALRIPDDMSQANHALV